VILKTNIEREKGSYMGVNDGKKGGIDTGEREYEKLL